MRGADGRFKRVLTASSREQQDAGRSKRPRRSADALAAAEARGECTAVHEPRKPQPLKAYNEFRKGLKLNNMKKDYAGAEEAYRAATRLDPRCADAHNNLGVLATRLDPEYVDAHVNLGILLKNVKKDYAGAEEAYRTAIRLDPEDAEVHNNLGVLLEEAKKDYAGAEQEYRTGIRLDPENELAHRNLAGLLEDNREREVGPGL